MVFSATLAYTVSSLLRAAHCSQALYIRWQTAQLTPIPGLLGPFCHLEFMHDHAVCSGQWNASRVICVAICWSVGEPVRNSRESVFFAVASMESRRYREAVKRSSLGCVEPTHRAQLRWESPSSLEDFAWIRNKLRLQQTSEISDPSVTAVLVA